MTLPVHVYSEAQAASGDPATVTLPAAATEGRLMVVVFRANAGLGVFDIVGVSGTGMTWNKIWDSDENGSIRANGWQEAWYCILPASPPASISVDVNTSRSFSAHIHIYEAATFDATTPIEAYAYADMHPASTSWAVPGVTVAGDAMLLAHCGAAGTTGTWTPDANYTERTDANEAGNFSTGSGDRQVSSAGTYTATWTYSVSDNGMASHIAIKGATGGGATDKAGTDTGVGADTGTLAASDTEADTGAGADTGILSVDITLAETGAGADSGSVESSGEPTGSDSGAGSEAATVAADLAGADTAVATDDVSAGVPNTGDDAGTGSDAVAAEQGATGADTGTSSENAVLAAEAAGTDTGSGADAGVLSYAEHLIGDFGAGLEGWAILATPPTVADTGAGVLEVVDVFLGALFNVTIDSVNRSSVVDLFSFSVEERAGGAVASFTITDKSATLGSPLNGHVEVTFQGTKVFGGYVRDVKPRLTGPTLHYDCKALDYSSLLDEDVIPDPAYRSATETDKARVEWLLLQGTKGITGGAYVQTVFGTMPGGSDDRPEQDFGGKTLREALDQVAKIAGAAWYVDALKQLHWYSAANGEGLAAPWNLSTVADATHKVIYDLNMPEYSADYRNAVYIRGTGIAGWYPDPPPAVGDRRAGALRDEDITTEAQLAAAGAAYLAAHAMHRSGEGLLVDMGLHPGMTVLVTHPGYGLVDAPYMVEAVEYRLANRARPYVRVVLGTKPPSIADIISGTGGRVSNAERVAVAAAAAISEAQAAGENLLKDSSFEAGTDVEWTVGTGWTRGFSSTAPFRGVKTARLNRSNASAGTLRSVDYVPVDRNSRYWFSAWSDLQTLGTNVQAEIRLLEYDSANTLLRTTAIATLTATEADWTRHSASFGPNDAVGVRAFHPSTAKVRVEFAAAGSDTTPTITWEVDGVQFERGTLLTAYAPAPDELYNAPGEVVIDASGVTIINGALAVKNPSGTVIIDGTSEMFKIQATGTYATTIASGGSGTTTFVDTGIANPADGSVPAFLAYLVEVGILNSRNIGSITAPPIVQYVASTSGGSPTTDVLVVRDWYTAGFERGTSTIRGYFRYNHRSAGDQNISLRWYVLKEAGI